MYLPLCPDLSMLRLLTRLLLPSLTLARPGPHYFPSLLPTYTSYGLAPRPAAARFSCPGPGYYRDPSSCTAFYRCLDWNSPAHRYICPPATRYDPAVRNCNHNFLAPPCSILPAQSGLQDLLPDISFQQDLFPGGLEHDIIPGLEQDLLPGLEQDILPEQDSLPGGGLQEDILPSLEQDVLPGGGFEEDILLGIELQQDGGLEEDLLFRPELEVEDLQVEKLWVVAAGSLFPCKQPGYYQDPASCSQFFACREVVPGVLSADRTFRCPHRYVFDPTTRLCQEPCSSIDGRILNATKYLTTSQQL